MPPVARVVLAELGVGVARGVDEGCALLWGGATADGV